MNKFLDDLSKELKVDKNLIEESINNFLNQDKNPFLLEKVIVPFGTDLVALATKLEKPKETLNMKSISSSKSISLYTDGSCLGNPGPGGWAVLILNDNKIILKGHSKDTTNNRMELTAPIKGLKYLKENFKNIEEVKIHTDSKYVKDGITSWINNWKKNGWKTANRQDVKNKDLWVELDSLISSFKIQWIWVKGHADDEYNNLVDKYAKEEASKV
jgi:ribonuclease HI